MPQVEMLVEYGGITIWTISKMERDPDRFLLPLDDGTNLIPNVDDLGIMIPVRSKWGPITLTVDFEGADSPAEPEQTWTGQVTFPDDQIWVESFSQIPRELYGLALPRGAGTYDIRVEWDYVDRPEGQDEDSDPPVETPWEKVTVWLR